MNSLARSASPYLRQHAHNPVQWYPWGEEAFARARAEDKPILLSVGYSACFWCHVMEREVFENPSIAMLMNTHFINIKMDREEHPDIDEIYMAARQAFTREGGWPNHVFLTPELKPFVAGGTFGPTDAYGKPGFPQVLRNVADAWENSRADVEQQAEKLTHAMRGMLAHGDGMPFTSSDVPAMAHNTFMQLSKVADGRAGGFFQAPKFPHENYLLFLLEYYRATRSARALEMLTQSLHRMAGGGIYDHVGGGFHRYAVDKDWLVPHFEKMLYNQALLALAYAGHHAATGDAYTADIGKSVLDFVSAALTTPEGAFYSAIDAETNGVEGAYYVWNAQELAGLLTPGQRAFMDDVYTFSIVPVYPGHAAAQGNVMSARLPLAEAAAKRSVAYTMLAGHVATCLDIMLKVRNRRTPPRMDDKILIGWNGLMIAALAQGGKAFGKPVYIERASNAARFILEHCRLEAGMLAHVFALGEPKFAALLEDYAYLVSGLLALAQATGDEEWLNAAASLMHEAHARLWDTEGGGYFVSGQDTSRIIRLKSIEDGALLSPGAVMLHNLIALHERTGHAEWKQMAESLAGAFASPGEMGAWPEAVTWLSGLMRLYPQALSDVPASAGVRLVPRDDSPPVVLSASLPSDAKPGSECEVAITLQIAEGWHINALEPSALFLTPTQIDVRGEGVEQVIGIRIAPPQRRQFAFSEAPVAIYSGKVEGAARIRLASAQGGKRGPVVVYVAYQPCTDAACFPVMHVTAEV